MKLLQNIFSVRNEGIHKIWTILGIKLKFKNKYKILETKIDNNNCRLQSMNKAVQNSLQTIKKDLLANIEGKTKQNNIELTRIKNAVTHETNFVKNAMRATLPMPNLKYFEVHLTEHCNLNCQSCTHWSPLADEGFTDIKEFEKDFARLSELSNKNVNVISLLGGEPLLNPQCTDFLYIARKYFPNTKIQFVTNGLLLLQQNQEFWDGMKINNIILRPTKYPIPVKWEEIEETAEKQQVKLEYYNDAKQIKTSFKIPNKLDGSLDPNQQFLSCWVANNCVFLSHGKLYTCTQAPNVKHFSKYFNLNIKEDEKDGIDIYKAKNMEEILNFLAKPIPFCRYCHMACIQRNILWKQSTKEITEWVE